MNEGYEVAKWNGTGQRVEGDMVMYSCDHCGFLHPFIKKKRKKFEREGMKKSRGIRWNIR
ncbi:hypothetical protein NQ095_11905 [Rossellomorea sp. SC111]|nr:hypothetical protein [Rossellomorea sp. SC111]